MNNNNNNQDEDNNLIFSSEFESGNLDLVIKLLSSSNNSNGMDNFDLYMRPDTNSCGHFQWYYFSVSNTR